MESDSEPRFVVQWAKYSSMAKAGLRVVKRSSGQKSRQQRSSGGGTQDAHNPWHTVDDIQKQLGVSREVAQDYYDAVNGGADGGFTRGWDGAIRAYEQGNLDDYIDSNFRAQDVINMKYNGDRDAYRKAVVKKADDCEKLIDAAPKWNGGELMRGYSLSPKEIADLTETGREINLNWGTASWTTDADVAKYQFAGSGQNGLIAHVVGERRGTSIDGLSHFSGQYADYKGAGEWEVLCSKHESFECVGKTVDPDGLTHAWYRVVSRNRNWEED